MYSAWGLPQESTLRGTNKHTQAELSARRGIGRAISFDEFHLVGALGAQLIRWSVWLYTGSMRKCAVML